MAAVCLCLLCFVNCYETTWAYKVQDYFTYAKVFALILIIVTGIYFLVTGHTQFFTWQNTETDTSKIALSFYSGLFAYTGWNFLNFIIEEMKDPVKDLPRAIAISCSACLIIYVMTIVAFHSILSVEEVLGSQAVAVTFANKVYGQMAFIIPLFVACSTFGAVNGTLLTSSRLFFAGAREGQMPTALTMIQTKKLTPAPSVLTITLLALLYLVVSDIGVLIDYVGFATWLAIGAAVLCLPWLRYTMPELERPIRVNLIFPVVYLAITMFITVFSMFQKPIQTLIGFAMIFSAIPVYVVFISWRNKPKFISRCSGSFTYLLQKLFIVVPASKDD